jgi:hypothetical protein
MATSTLEGLLSMYEDLFRASNSGIYKGELPSYESMTDQIATRLRGQVDPMQVSVAVHDLYATYGNPPEQTYIPMIARASSGTPTATSGTSRASGPSQSEIAAYNAKVEADYADAIRKAEREKATQLQKYQDTLADLGQSEQQLGTSRGEGLASNASYFSNISPDAYQSQISRYNTKVQDSYKQGMETTGRNKQRVNEAVGSYNAEYQDYVNSLQRQKGWDISNYGKSAGASQYSNNAAQPYQEAQTYNPQSQSAWTAPQAQPTNNKGVVDTTWDWLNKVYKTGNIF